MNNEEDTVRLLRKCNAGCKTATNSMGQVLPHLPSGELRRVIQSYNRAHVKIGDTCHRYLSRLNAEEKDPPSIADAMMKVETGIKLGLNGSEEKVADIMHKGCSTGVRGLSRYLNAYKDADEDSRELVAELIRTEEEFAKDLQSFL